MSTLTAIHLTRAGQNLTRDCQAVHRTLAHILGPTTRDRWMWALPKPRLLLVQASTPLTADSLPGLVATITHRTVQTKYTAGTRVHVAAIVNPATNATIAATGRVNPRGIPDDQLDGWATARLGAALDVETLTVQRLTPSRGVKPGGHRITVDRAAIAATGTVTDPDALASLVLGGFPKNRTYGTGIVLVREVSRG